MQIYNGKIERNELNEQSKGGTELLTERLVENLPQDLLQEFQIVVSRERSPLDPTKIRLYYAHDLPGDPEADKALGNNRWERYHRIVCVSNWQMQMYGMKYNIPWSKMIVIPNFVNNIPHHDKPNGPIRLAYWSTPHRGLNILVTVFKKLTEKYSDIILDVYSSFGIYGWEERDKEFESLFEECRNHPQIEYHGSVDNSIISENILKTHILAYPSIWTETSCMVLMEAMAGGLICVHPNLGALYETAANWTYMYQWHEDMNIHASIFYSVLDAAIEIAKTGNAKSQLESQASYANIFYGWHMRGPQWVAFLQSLINEPREFPIENFVYCTS